MSDDETPKKDNVVRGRFPPAKFPHKYPTPPSTASQLPDGMRQIYQGAGAPQPSMGRTWDGVMDQAVRSYIEMLQNYIDSQGPDIPAQVRYGCFKMAVSAAFLGFAPGYKPLDLNDDAQVIARAAYDHAKIVIDRDKIDWSNRHAVTNAIATAIQLATAPPFEPPAS